MASFSDSLTTALAVLVRRRSGAAPPPETQRATLERLLHGIVVPFWYPRVIDEAHGGYRLHHDVDGTWKGPAPKRAVAQARTLWFFTRLAASPYGTAAHREAARHGFAFLSEALWDAKHGGFFWEVSMDGRVPTTPLKHLYGQAFGLYALTEYAALTGDALAAERAAAVFDLIETHAYDRRDGGYHECFAEDWSALPPGTPCPLHSEPATKLANTHLHLVESFARYQHFAPSDRVRARLVELLLTSVTALVAPGTASLGDRYAPGWRPEISPARTSYGHDVEFAWLLVDAFDAAALPAAPALRYAAGLFDNACRHGFDALRGGFFEAGPEGRRADARDKVWWVQAEGLLCALFLHQRLGGARYAEVFARTVEWLARHQTDPVHGDLHTVVTARGGAVGAKAGPWRTPYHHGRALLEALRLLAPPAAYGPPGTPPPADPYPSSTP